MFYFTVSDLNNTYECSRRDKVVPYGDPGSQIVIKFVNMVEYMHPLPVILDHRTYITALRSLPGTLKGYWCVIFNNDKWSQLGTDQNGLLAAGPDFCRISIDYSVSRILPDQNRLLGRANIRLPELAGMCRNVPEFAHPGTFKLILTIGLLSLSIIILILISHSL